MKKFRFLFLFAFAFGVLSCSNQVSEDEPLLPEEALRPQDIILNALRQHNELSNFTAAFSAVDLAPIKAKELTVFAVPNGSFTNPVLRSSATNPCDETIIDRHIIAGQYKQADLTDSLFLKSIDGTELLITIIDGRIFINGAELTTLIPAGENAIFVVDKSIPCTSPEPPEASVIPVSGLTVTQSVLSLKVGDTKNIALLFEPYNATNKEVTWQIDKTGIVEIKSPFESDSLFSITAKAEGKVNVLFTTKDGGYSATCEVTVNNNTSESGEDNQSQNPSVVTGISVSQPSLSLGLGQKDFISVSVEPASATNKKVSWKIDKQDIVEIETVISDSIFTVNAKKEGIAIITFATSEGDYKATCIVTVSKTTAAISFNQDSNIFMAFLDRKKTFYLRQFT